MMIAPAIKPSMLSQKKGEKSPFPVAVTSTPSHTACRDTCQPTLSSVATLEARYKMMNVKRLLTVISRRNVKHHRHTTVGGLDGLQCLQSQVSRALELQSRSFSRFDLLLASYVESPSREDISGESKAGGLTGAASYIHRRYLIVVRRISG